MREDAISVLVQHTLEPELSGDVAAPDARVNVQAPRTWRSGSAQSLPCLAYPKNNHSQKGTKPAMSNPSNQVLEAGE
jgi:hypothetical protein